MNVVPKQAFVVKDGKGFSKAQSDEHQRRWSEKAWQHAVKNGNYDRSREHLNFEITKGGVVHAVDKSKTIPERIAEQVDKRGLIDKNRGLKEPRFRTVANIIYSGNADRMRELGFGSQSIDFTKGADNSHLRRHEDIEKWALDMYRFTCEQWGEENIVQFICHMDESSPHIHCTVLPVDERNYLSYKRVFAGKDRFEYSAYIRSLHDKLSVVNAKWGLSRGTSRKVRTISTEHYHRNLQDANATLESRCMALNDQIRQAEKRVKGLTTMIQNAEAKYAKLLDDIEALEQKLKVAGDEHESILAELEAKRAELRDVKKHIADKRDKLDDANRILDELKAQTDASRQRLETLKAHIHEADKSMLAIAKSNVAIVGMETMANEFQRAFSAMATAENAYLFDDSLLKDMAERGNEILICAWMLFGNYVNQATQFAQSHGGGGTSSDLPWGRKEDEDDRCWAFRCLNQARKMMKPAGRKLRR